MPLSRCALGIAAVLALASAAGAQLQFSPVVLDEDASGDDKGVGDLDLDGRPDGILGGDSLAWYRSLGPARGFVRHEIRAQPLFQEFSTDMAVADVDGDGDLDLLVADGGGAGNVLWFENPLLAPDPSVDPDPTVGANWLHHTIGSHGGWAHDFAFGDVEPDGDLDVVTGGNGHLHLWLQTTAGVFSDRDLSALADAGPALADIDGDDDLDLFASGAWLECPENPLTGAWEVWPIAGSDPGDGPAQLALDVDGDGRLDLLTARQHSRGRFAWFEQPVDPRLGAWELHEIDGDQGSHHLRAADFDGDGRLDLVAGLELVEIAIYRNLGGDPPTFAKQVVAASGGHNAEAADFDGNGLADLWSADYIGHPPLAVLWNSPDTIFRDGFEAGDAGAWR